ncbi:MAG TPA: M13 family metallopeptidase [Myxococcaceae bacterium]|nr:M13 family metallopeptidase [Myxococcaceae bacterium]
MIRCLVVVLAAALATCASSPQRAPEAAPAVAPSGIEVSDLNRAIDPCTDFYEFANGGWRAANPIPPSMKRWSRQLLSREANQRQLQAILEALSSRTDWPAGSIEQQLGDYYASCMDEGSVETAGLAPLAPLLAEIASARSSEDVQRIIRRLHRLAIPVGFALTGAYDYQVPDNTLANITAGSLGLPSRDHYLSPEPRFAAVREKYRAHLAIVLGLGGMPEARASKAAEEVFALEKRLAEASLDAATAADPAATAHRTTPAQLEQLAPRVDWGRYFAEATLPRSDLNVAEPKLLQQLDKELKDTSLATWRAYLTWQLLDSASPWLSKPFAKASFDFRDKLLGGATTMRPRAALCIESSNALFGDALGQKYVERYFPPAAKAKVQELIRALLGVMKEDLTELRWLGPETKKQALEKLATYDVQVGYPNKWKDYSTITIRRDALWANVVAGRKFNVEDNRKLIGKPTDRELWQLPPSSPDAYIEPQLNQIVLPAGFLQPPAFNLEATDAVNFGAIGIGVAHDMTHTFDSLGGQFDSAGRPRSWWAAADLEEFGKRGQCVAEQYEGYFIEPGVHHDGKRVLNEAIADLAGVRLAYLAMKRGRPGPAVDGFTPEQQFFLAWGQYRGAAESLEYQRQLVKGDPHPTARFRIIGSLSNLPEFQQAFSCQPGAKMARSAEQRCSVW